MWSWAQPCRSVQSLRTDVARLTTEQLAERKGACLSDGLVANTLQEVKGVQLTCCSVVFLPSQRAVAVLVVMQEVTMEFLCLLNAAESQI